MKSVACAIWRAIIAPLGGLIFVLLVLPFVWIEALLKGTRPKWPH